MFEAVVHIEENCKLLISLPIFQIQNLQVHDNTLAMQKFTALILNFLVQYVHQRILLATEREH